MTKDDTAAAAEAGGFLSPTVRRIAIVLVGLPLFTFALGVLAGYAKGMFDDSAPKPIDFAILAGLALVTGAIAYGAWRLWPREPSEVVAKSTRRSMQILGVAFALGLVSGLSFAFATEGEALELFSNGPLDPGLAIGGIIFLAIIIPAISWVWWRTIDEHEASAYTLGALISAHVYLIIVPVWWLAARAGWVPHQDSMIVWVVISAVWTVVWLYRRFT